MVDGGGMTDERRKMTTTATTTARVRMKSDSHPLPTSPAVIVTATVTVCQQRTGSGCYREIKPVSGSYARYQTRYWTRHPVLDSSLRALGRRQCVTAAGSLIYELHTVHSNYLVTVSLITVILLI